MKIEKVIVEICELDETKFYNINKHIITFRKETKRKNATITLAMLDEMIDMLCSTSPTHQAIMVIVPMETYKEIKERDDAE